MSQRSQSVPFQLIAGFPFVNAESSEALLSDLYRFRVECNLAAIVICGDSNDFQLISPWFARLRSAGIQVRRVSESEIRRSALNGRFGRYYSALERQSGIAFFRTALHHYLYLESFRFAHPVVWVLDEDVRLEESWLRRQSSQTPFCRLVPDLESQGVDIAVGRILGDPPIPSASMLRTQLLDLDFNLRVLRNRNFVVRPEQMQRQNSANVEKYPDFYYDLTLSHYGHLETPWFYISQKGQTNRLSVLDEMLERVPQVPMGVNLFRQIPEAQKARPGQESEFPTRGGNTLIFDISSLRDYPNISPRAGGLDFRRGDTLWTILNKRTESGGGPRKVVSTDLPVRQDRRHNRTSSFDADSLLADILGGAFTRAVNEVLGGRTGSVRAPGEEFRFTEEENCEHGQHLRKRLGERLELLRLNSWRIAGLVDSIHSQIGEARQRGGPEWIVIRKHAAEIENLLAAAERAFSPDMAEKLAARAMASPRKDIEEFLQGLAEYCRSYRDQLLAWDRRLGTDDVISFLKLHFGDRRFRLLAAGSEGFVFSDGRFAYKYFYYGLHNFRPGQLEFIRRACSAGRLSWSRHIHPVERVLVDGQQVVFVSRLLKGPAYQGGRLGGVLGLLRECRRANIVLTNISPGNLIVTGATLRYVDIGRSVERFDEHGFKEMCRRAFLVYRWHFRSDLRELLTRAVDDDSLPELIGFEQFMAALEEKGVHDVLDTTLFEAIMKKGPRRVFDYGCGNGEVADKLARLGCEVSAFDIDGRRFRAHRHPENVKLVDKKRIGEILASPSTYDVVLCSLVLCTIEGAQTVARILHDLRHLVKPRGRVVVCVCNPFSLETRESETQVKEVPAGVSYSDHFAYRKRLKITRGVRLDYHRPVSWYRMMMKRAGLEISELVEVPGTDVDRLCLGSDFLLFCLKPAPVPKSSNISLLIKASAMEWRTIDKQVSHLLSQLEVPRLFMERVVVVDRHEGPFARQYDSADIHSLERSLRSMVRRGTIDRVLVAPSGGKESQGIARRWFSLDAPALRSTNGQPVLTTLYGLDGCRGEYVLHVDSDCLISRPDGRCDYLADVLKVFRRDPLCVTVSFPIATSSRHAYTSGDGKKKWRTEARCGFISKPRLERMLPLPNQIAEAGLLMSPWHRALDLKLERAEFQSYRGSERGISFIHVPNSRKADFNSWYNIMKAIEAGQFHVGQLDSVDLVGRVEDWLPRRDEGCVLVVRGRNVPISKLRRCFDSLEKQSDQDWGLLITDAGSDNGADEYIEQIIGKKYGRRMTFYRNLVPEAPVANIDFVLRSLCASNRSIIIMPDADDTLIGSDAVTYVKSMYEQGADLGIGGLLRTDKEVNYQANFDHPRLRRGGNVWQPLKSFRKHLYDRVRPEDLKVDGEWVPHTEDWAFMLPMAEMAEKPVQFQRIIYLYEPSPLKQTLAKEERESLIAKMVSKPSYGGP